MQKTEGIILRRREIRETSLILITYTRDLGKIHGLVKGVRGAASAVPWYLEPLTLQTMVLYERRRSPWSLVSACDLLDAFDPIRRDLTRISYASFCLDAVDSLTESGDPHPEISLGTEREADPAQRMAAADDDLLDLVEKLVQQSPLFGRAGNWLRFSSSQNHRRSSFA